MTEQARDTASCPRCGSEVPSAGWYCHDCHPFICPDCLADTDDSAVSAVQREFEQNAEVLDSYSPRELAGIAIAAARRHENETRQDSVSDKLRSYVARLVRELDDFLEGEYSTHWYGESPLWTPEEAHEVRQIADQHENTEDGGRRPR